MITLCIGLATAAVIQAATISITVYNTPKQHITGFGAACCDGAMCPFGTDTNPVKLLYGSESLPSSVPAYSPKHRSPTC